MSHADVFEVYTEVAAPKDLRVLSWKCTEAICAPFRVELVVGVAAGAADELAARLLGQRATFAAHSGVAPSLTRRGVITSVDCAGSVRAGHAELHLAIVPRLELMRLRTGSRIFENLTTGDLVKRLVDEWGIEADLRLAGSYSPRTYVTQYRESDYDFLVRVASRDGIGFFLEHRELEADEASKESSKLGSERIVFFDNTEAYPDIPPPVETALGSRLVHHGNLLERREHHVDDFRLERRIRPEMVRLADFDFRKPQLPLRASSKVPDVARTPIGTALGGEQLVHGFHADRAELDATPGANVEIGDPVAAIRLQQARRDAAVGRASSRCGRLVPGSTFTIDEHPDLASLNREMVVTRVVHQGRLPEASGQGAVEEVYGNAFECVPASVVYRTAPPVLDVRQAAETATVVGPKGTELHCDEHGRVKVLFHWDHGGGEGDTRSAWLRCAQSWAGANWGSQFIPRVGMEVLINFLAGDVDRPIVVGAVYNGTHPLPFPLPDGARKSGFRTHSTPGGDGGSELSFDDTKGDERIYLRAEKDMSQVVDNDFDMMVKGGSSIRVEGASQHTVGGGATSDVLGDMTQRIAKSFEASIAGSHTLSVTGSSDLRVSGDRTTRIEGVDRAEHFGASEVVFRSDVLSRAEGHLVTVVGKNGARRSATLHVEGGAYQYSTGACEIASDKSILLRCGDSSIRLTPDGIDLVTKSLRVQSETTVINATDTMEAFAKEQIALVSEKAIDVLAKKTIILKAETGEVRLDQNAKVGGTKIKLASAESVEEKEAPGYEPPKTTKIELLDENGKPLGSRRWVVVESDGSERSGMLDADGKAEIVIEEAAEIFFPDVDDARHE